MVKLKVPESERKSLKKLVKQYYGGKYTTPIIAKAAERGVTLSGSDVYSFFNQGIIQHSALINDIVFTLVQEAKAKGIERKEKLNIMASPPKSATL